MAMAGTVAGLAAQVEIAAPTAAAAQSNLTPDAALEALMAGNKRFADGKRSCYDHDFTVLHGKIAEKQEPFAAVLSCADSRVPVELIFDQGIGQVFVTRVAGNIVTSEIMASLEYGAAVLGTKVLLVIGHSNCGAVNATIQGKAVPGQISALYPHIQPAVDQAGPDLAAATKANAQIQAGLLRQASPVLSSLVKEGKLKIAAAFYDVGSGRVTLL
jgi:carbonic anhydrase